MERLTNFEQIRLLNFKENSGRRMTELRSGFFIGIIVLDVYLLRKLVLLNLNI